MAENNDMFIFIDPDPEWLDFCQKTLQKSVNNVRTFKSIHAVQEQVAGGSFDFSVYNIFVIVNVLLVKEYVDAHAPTEVRTSTKDGQTRRKIREIFPGFESLYVAVELIDQSFDILREMYRLGVDLCLLKPYSEVDLRLAIEQIKSDRKIDRSIPVPEQIHEERRILVVDDEKDWQRILSRILRELSYKGKIRVDTKGDFASAHKAILENVYDLCIINTNLRGSDDQLGLDLIDLIRLQDNEHHRTTAIIATSGGTRREQQLKLFQDFKIDHFLNKAADAFSVAEFRLMANSILK
jgi:CheY-like chemotaxis protein